MLFPRVVIPVDLFGLPADHEKIANKHGILVLEYAAQGIGGKIKSEFLLKKLFYTSIFYVRSCNLSSILHPTNRYI